MATVGGQYTEQIEVSDMPFKVYFRVPWYTEAFWWKFEVLPVPQPNFKKKPILLLFFWGWPEPKPWICHVQHRATEAITCSFFLLICLSLCFTGEPRTFLGHDFRFVNFPISYQSWSNEAVWTFLGIVYRRQNLSKSSPSPSKRSFFGLVVWLVSFQIHTPSKRSCFPGFALTNYIWAFFSQFMHCLLSIWAFPADWGSRVFFHIRRVWHQANSSWQKGKANAFHELWCPSVDQSDQSDIRRVYIYEEHMQLTFETATVWKMNEPKANLSQIIASSIMDTGVTSKHLTVPHWIDPFSVS